MGVRVASDMGDQQHLDALDKAGLKDEIMQMQKLSLNDPAQAVEAQEKLDALLPKINQAFKAAGLNSDVTCLQYKDAKAGETIQTDAGRSGGLATLNDAIQGFNKQAATPAPQSLTMSQDARYAIQTAAPITNSSPAIKGGTTI
jgi:hypothetical protein